MLPVPRCPIDDYTAILYTDNRFVIIYHDRPLFKLLPPEPCMCRLAGAAFCGKKIALAVHCHTGTVKEEGIVFRYFFCNLPIDSQRLQIAVRKMTDWDALPLIFIRRPFSLEFDIRPNCFHGKIRLTLRRQIISTETVNLFVERTDPNIQFCDSVCICHDLP